MNAHAQAKGGGEEGIIFRSRMSLHLVHETSMWANMRIIVLLNSLKVGVTRSLRRRQMDLCANGAGAYAPYAPPLPTGLIPASRALHWIRKTLSLRGYCQTGANLPTERKRARVPSIAAAMLKPRLDYIIT